MKSNPTSYRLKDTELQANYDKLFKILESFGDRSANLKTLYESFGERIVFDPASSFEHFHNAIPGGYIDHVLRVIEFSEILYDTWVSLGLNVDNFTKEELRFAALNHDLGKLGFPGEQNGQYLPNKSEWHKKNMGRLYESNASIPFLLVPDRALYLLQVANIPVSLNEYLGIKLTDGLYDDSNKAYLFASKPESKLRCNMPYILHNADMMASRLEYELWNQSAGKFNDSMDFNSLSADLSDQYVNPDKLIAPKAPTTEFDNTFNDLFSSL